MSVRNTLRLVASVRLVDGRPVVRESRHTDPAWRGAELLVAAVATGYAMSLSAAAGRLSIPVHGLEVEAAGHLTARRGGRYGLVGIELDSVLETDPGNEERLPLAAELARDRCAVVGALDVPLSHRVRAAAPALQEAAT